MGLERFKQELLALLDRDGFLAIPQIFSKIRASNFGYNPIIFKNLEQQSFSKLVALDPIYFISQVRGFIETLSESQTSTNTQNNVPNSNLQEEKTIHSNPNPKPMSDSEEPIWQKPIVKWVGGIIAATLISLATYLGFSTEKKTVDSKPSHFIVQGRLVDQDNNPLTNQDIIVNGKSDATDQIGNFSVSGVKIGADSIIQFSIGTETLNKTSTEYLIQGNTISISKNLRVKINKKGRK